MSWQTELLAIVVTISVVGQAGLILWGNRSRRVDHRQVAEDRARLVEAAADRQLETSRSQMAKLDGKGGGDE
jgi:hypothetical protein